jgi:hypothetical protein
MILELMKEKESHQEATAVLLMTAEIELMRAPTTAETELTHVLMIVETAEPILQEFMIEIESHARTIETEGRVIADKK